jgi:catechol 2,3-dioxygenase-like lactoylglutathione lyase family enzyme
MFDHVGLRVKDLRASVRFYTSVLAPLGYALDTDSAEAASFGPPGQSMLWLHQVGGAGGQGVHVAFRAPTRVAVDRFHAAGLQAGGRDNGAAGHRPDYSPTYYAAFLVDPDGNNVEAVCMEAAG